MPLLPYDYLHLVNCPEVVTISDILCIKMYSSYNHRALLLPYLNRFQIWGARTRGRNAKRGGRTRTGGSRDVTSR